MEFVFVYSTVVFGKSYDENGPSFRNVLEKQLINMDNVQNSLDITSICMTVALFMLRQHFDIIFCVTFLL
jgi:hypothetical protein